MSFASHEPVVVESMPTARFGSLIEFAASSRPMYYRHGDIEIVGIGERARWTERGPGRFAALGEHWKQALLTIKPELRHHVVALGTGQFDPNGDAHLVVPRVAIVRRGRDVSVVTIGDTASLAEPTRRAVGVAPVVEWPHIDSVYRDRVRAALSRLDSTFGKVVVARAITGEVTTPGDERAPLCKLTAEYPDTHIFALDGLWGASPETLVRVDRQRVSARVLAGSAARGWDSATDAAAAAALVASQKDRDEHEYAVTSVVSALAPHCRSIVGAETPFTLRLANVWHLASDIAGVLGSTSNLFDLIDSLHPTAAVAGVPTDRALTTISEVEAIPRDRYAGPIGWVDGAGNGEWAIALRCAQWGDAKIVAHAGAGIIEGSDPESEFAETELKFQPIRGALAG
ncbi:MAG: isochorismate synthase MenF [Microbacteriaceae bacterium]